MFKRYIKRILIANRDFLLKEAVAANGIMRLLMKNRNTGEQWTKNELGQLRSYFLSLLLIVPALIIFLLPFGSLLLPILAEVLERRSKPRQAQDEKRDA